MGCRWTFLCPGCGYDSGLVSGCADIGELVETLTCHCLSCGKLVDVIQAIHETQPSPGRLALLKCCPTCGGQDLDPWPEHHPCPRCGTSMEVDPDGPSILWD